MAVFTLCRHVHQQGLQLTREPLRGQVMHFTGNVHKFQVLSWDMHSAPNMVESPAHKRADARIA